MKNSKKYITFSMVFVIYVAATALLLRQFYACQRAYYALGQLISHPSIEQFVEEEKEE